MPYFVPIFGFNYLRPTWAPVTGTVSSANPKAPSVNVNVGWTQSGQQARQTRGRSGERPLKPWGDWDDPRWKQDPKTGKWKWNEVHQPQTQATSAPPTVSDTPPRASLAVKAPPQSLVARAQSQAADPNTPTPVMQTAQGVLQNQAIASATSSALPGSPSPTIRSEWSRVGTG